jgi:D-alanyl-D-alanine dipeptidase
MRSVFLTFLLPAALLAQDPMEAPFVPAADSVASRMLVDVQRLDSTIVVDARYATRHNFTGAVLPGYHANRVLLRREAAEALARVQRRLVSGGMGLKVFDGYRPVRATAGMMRWAEGAGRQDLFADGYISSRSRHNLGLAIDLTLVDLSMGGREVDMGTPYDTLNESAHWANASGRTLRYRQLLRRVMEEEGFRQYEQEWWHYSFEVAGETPAFDLEVR